MLSFDFRDRNPDDDSNLMDYKYPCIQKEANYLAIQ